MIRMCLISGVAILSLVMIAGGSTTTAPNDAYAYDANKSLGPAEADQLIELILQLLDKDHPRRREAARRIGEEVPHRSAIPVLKKVSMNEEEDLAVRDAALTALSQISHESVIPVLIDAHSDFEPVIRGRALEQMWKISGCRVQSSSLRSPDVSEEEIHRLQQIWTEWWESNRATFRFNRSRVLSEH